VIKPLKGKHWIGNGGQQEGRKDRSKPAKGPFRRMQENVAKHLSLFPAHQEMGGKQGKMEVHHEWNEMIH